MSFHIIDLLQSLLNCIIEFCNVGDQLSADSGIDVIVFEEFLIDQEGFFYVLEILAVNYTLSAFVLCDDRVLQLEIVVKDFLVLDRGVENRCAQVTGEPLIVQPLLNFQESRVQILQMGVHIDIIMKLDFLADFLNQPVDILNIQPHICLFLLEVF